MPVPILFFSFATSSPLADQCLGRHFRLEKIDGAAYLAMKAGYIELILVVVCRTQTRKLKFNRGKIGTCILHVTLSDATSGSLLLFNITYQCNRQVQQNISGVQCDTFQTLGVV